MKTSKIIFILLITLLCFSSCETEDDSETLIADISCGTYNGNRLYKGPEGGCYYYNGNGNKTYVDRSECNC